MVVFWAQTIFLASVAQQKHIPDSKGVNWENGPVVGLWVAPANGKRIYCWAFENPEKCFRLPTSLNYGILCPNLPSIPIMMTALFYSGFPLSRE
jgi:hypothetical protein